jgi:hypothetical protein
VSRASWTRLKLLPATADEGHNARNETEGSLDANPSGKAD